MKLFLISQNECNGYDSYDSAVVAAVDETAAKQTYPGSYTEGWDENLNSWYYLSNAPDTKGQKIPHFRAGDWASHPNQVEAEYLGETDKPAGVICASFNAG